MSEKRRYNIVAIFISYIYTLFFCSACFLDYCFGDPRVAYDAVCIALVFYTQNKMIFFQQKYMICEWYVKLDFFVYFFVKYRLHFEATQPFFLLLLLCFIWGGEVERYYYQFAFPIIILPAFFAPFLPGCFERLHECISVATLWCSRLLDTQHMIPSMMSKSSYAVFWVIRV